MTELGLGLLAVAAVWAVFLLARRGPEPGGLQALEQVARTLGQLQAELTRVGRAQEDLRHELHHDREASLLQIERAAQGLHAEIGQAHRALAEVKALDQGRASQLEQAATSLKRLEAVLAGSSTRGAAGENILARALAQLPPDLLECNVAFGNKVVEYALRLPRGRLLPIDSKWPSVGTLERFEAAEGTERQQLTEQVGREVQRRVRDMAKYLDPERTLGLGLVTVPDAVYLAAPEVHADGYREGVLIAPYSLALPYLLLLYRLAVRFGTAVDPDQLAARLRALEEALRQMDEEVEGRLSRGLTQLQNAREALRDRLAESRRGIARLTEEAESSEASPPRALARAE
jgi:DNA recombination protein RmuC